MDDGVDAEGVSYRGKDGVPTRGLQTYYSENLEVGYRWFQAKDVRPLYSFGHGLSYADFVLREVSATVVRRRWSLGGRGGDEHELFSGAGEFVMGENNSTLSRRSEHEERRTIAVRPPQPPSKPHDNSTPSSLSEQEQRQHSVARLATAEMLAVSFCVVNRQQIFGGHASVFLFWQHPGRGFKELAGFVRVDDLPPGGTRCLKKSGIPAERAVLGSSAGGGSSAAAENNLAVEWPPTVWSAIEQRFVASPEVRLFVGMSLDDAEEIRLNG